MTKAPFSRSLGDRSMFSGDLPLVAFLRSLLNPTIILATLAVCLALYGVKLDGHYLMLAVLTFFVSSQLFERVDLFQLRPTELIVRAMRDIFFAWPLTVGIVAFLIWATHYDQIYDTQALIAWFIVTPVPLILGHLFAHGVLRILSRAEAAQKRVVVVGMSDLSIRLAGTITGDPLLGVHSAMNLSPCDDLAGEDIAPDLGPGGNEQLHRRPDRPFDLSLDLDHAFADQVPDDRGARGDNRQPAGVWPGGAPGLGGEDGHQFGSLRMVRGSTD